MRRGGVALRVDVAGLVAGECARERLRRTVAGLLAGGESVGVTVAAVGHGTAARSRLDRLLEVLAAARERAGATGRRIELGLPARALPPAEAWRLRHAFLGAGSLYLVTERASFVAAAGATGRGAIPGAFWPAAWRVSAGGFVHCLHATTVAPSTPLLATEDADAVLPELGLAVPAGSAWVTGRIDVADFADHVGNVDWARLGGALEARIDEGDRVHDETRWPTAAMCHDSWRNRRLGILLSGIGELALRQGALPLTRERRRELALLVARIRDVLIAHSRVLAGRHGVLPALAANDPTRILAASRDGAWARRWTRALERAGVRHRNLLALSPFSLLPTSPAPDARSFDLLPLIEQADACAACGSISPGRWKYREFMELQRRTWAALERARANRLIAEQV